MFTDAIRADLLIRKGQKAEGAKLREEVMTSSVKSTSNSSLDFYRLAAKMHADKL